MAGKVGTGNRLVFPNEIQDNTAIYVTGGFARGDAKIVEINFAHSLKGGFVFESNYIIPIYFV